MPPRQPRRQQHICSRVARKSETYEASCLGSILTRGLWLTFPQAHVMPYQQSFSASEHGRSIMQVVQEKSDGSEKKAEKP